MFLRHLSECEEIVANDLTRLRELFHPEKDGLPLSFSLAHAILPPGARSLRHHLEGSAEVYYILNGRGVMHVGEESRAVGPGDTLLIPAGAVQFLENPGPEEIHFLALVEPAWEAHRDHRAE
ncbi:MAG: cupin domain-containing protein [Armatimonadetes bacterium]|nr:cupin domain-containing protein [Armatimonadota bacterium]